MAQIGNRIRKARKEKHLSQDKLLDEVFAITGERVTRQTLSAWETGRGEPRAGHLKAIAAVLGVSVSDLVSDAGGGAPEEGLRRGGAQGNLEEAQIVIEKPTPGFSNELIRVPVYDDLESVCAGLGIDNVGEESVAVEFLDIPKWLLSGRFSGEQGKCPYIVSIYGDSMKGADIPDGSQALVNPIAEANDGDVIIAELDGKRMIKWIYWDRFGDGGELRSASSRYPVRYFSHEDVTSGRFRYLGKVCRVLNMPLKGE